MALNTNPGSFTSLPITVSCVCIPSHSVHVHASHAYGAVCPSPRFSRCCLLACQSVAAFRPLPPQSPAWMAPPLQVTLVLRIGWSGWMDDEGAGSGNRNDGDV